MGNQKCLLMQQRKLDIEEPSCALRRSYSREKEIYWDSQQREEKMRMRCCEARFHVDTKSSWQASFKLASCSSLVVKGLGFMLHACDLLIAHVISVLGSYSQSVCKVIVCNRFLQCGQACSTRQRVSKRKPWCTLIASLQSNKKSTWHMKPLTAYQRLRIHFGFG